MRRRAAGREDRYIELSPVHSALLLFIFFAYSLGFFVKKSPFDNGFLGLKNLKTPVLGDVSTILMTDSGRSC